MKKPRWGLWVIALDVVALVVLIFVYPHLMIGAGPLLAGHEPVAADCFACHAPLRGAATARCVGCHEPAQIGLRNTLGVALPASARLKVSFHQELLRDDCMACHTDHRGAVQPAELRRRFSHELIKPSAQLACEGCHRAPEDSLHRQVAGDCQACHGTQAWKPATFEHTKFFELDKDHDTACATCHVPSAGRTDFKTYTCYGCHEHTPAKMRDEHTEEGITNFDNCVECHRNARDEPGKGARGEGRPRQDSQRGKGRD
ncbi:MAG: class III cytochrome C family protein [Betaproteobacteria bacterium]|nr:class III cytochrome C family protein [Betaproteobacteria bacterium]